MKNIALIMAAGQSRRCGFDKLLAELHQKSVLEQCLNTFERCELIDEIWVVGKSEVDLEAVSSLSNEKSSSFITKNQGRPRKLKGFIAGGTSRFQSVKNALEHCSNYYKESQNVRILVHNAANPHLTKVDLEKGLTAAKNKPSLVFGFFSPNAIKQVSKEGVVNNFLDRDQIFETQTPQISTLQTFEKALTIWEQQIPGSKNHKLTDPGIDFPEPKDEAELLALTGETIHVYECDPSNTKITFASDFKGPLELKLGWGEDSHRFSKSFDTDKPFRLGGIDMSENRLSSDGNSDGDLIIHALCNALLSAYGEKTFDPIAAPICAAGETKSEVYLKATCAHLENLGHALELKQVLISLEGSQPKIAPQHDAIVENLSKLLNIKPKQIGLTYTTGEGLNDYGKGLGMRAYTLVTLSP